MKCVNCSFMTLTGSQRRTANQPRGCHPRNGCICSHPDAVAKFNEVCPRSPKTPAFIAFTKMGGNKPQIKTAPRWCPYGKKVESTTTCSVCGGAGYYNHEECEVCCGSGIAELNSL